MGKALTTKTKKPPAKLNAVTHGILSQHLLLQWEDADIYEALLEELREEYAPESTTERHLVEELAGIIWRKGRLKIAEAAHYRREMSPSNIHTGTVSAALAYIRTDMKMHDFDIKEALASSEEENRQEIKEIASYREPVIKALALLEAGKTYEKALETLAQVTRGWWREDALGEEIYPGKVYQATAEDLGYFLRSQVMPFYNQQHEEIRYRLLVKQQAENEAFIPGDRLERFTRYEVHLDRKFERTITVLLRLQEMRKHKGTDSPSPQSA